MSNQHNTITIEGNLVSDPEVRNTTNGTPIANFTIANNRAYPVKGTTEWKKDPTYIEIKAWADLSTEVANKLGKGDTILAIGRISLDSWNDKTTGAKRTKHFITLDKFLKIEKQQRQERPAESAPAVSATAPSAEPEDQSIPF